MFKFNVPNVFWEDLFWQNTSLVLVSVLNFLVAKKSRLSLLTLVQIYQLVNTEKTVLFFFEISLIYKFSEVRHSHNKGIQEKFYKAEQDCSRAQGTDWDFSRNWGFEIYISNTTTGILSLMLYFLLSRMFR